MIMVKMWSCPVVGFVISDIEFSCFAVNRYLVGSFWKLGKWEGRKRV